MLLAHNWPLVRIFIVVALFTTLGFFFPQLLLQSQINARQKDIRKAMPDALDLLTICVEAGLGFDAALSKVGEKWESQTFYRFVTRDLRDSVGKAVARCTEGYVGTDWHCRNDELCSRSDLEREFGRQLGESLAHSIRPNAHKAPSTCRRRSAPSANQNAHPDGPDYFSFNLYHSARAGWYTNSTFDVQMSFSD